MIIGIIASQITAVAHIYAITSGYVSGGRSTTSTISYIIKVGTTTVKSGTISTLNGNVALTAGEISTFNTAIGTDGGTFTVIDSTYYANGSHATLSLTFSTDGAGATTKSATAYNDMYEVSNGTLIIP